MQDEVNNIVWMLRFHAVLVQDNNIIAGPEQVEKICVASACCVYVCRLIFMIVLPHQNAAKFDINLVVL